MKNKVYNLYLIAFFLMLDFVAFAQAGPGDGDGTGGGLEGDETPPAPINNKLVWLVILALIYAFYSIQKNRKLLKS